MRRILLIEDNENNILVVEDVFRRHRAHYRLEVLREAEPVHGRVRDDPPDLILLDMGLPRIAGWELAAILKGDPATAGVPIIAVTAHAMRDDRDRALAAGCDEFVTKPVRRDDLLSKVFRFLPPPAG